MEEWDKDKVKQWAMSEVVFLEGEEAELLFSEKITGDVLPTLSKEDFQKCGLRVGSVKKT